MIHLKSDKTYYINESALSFVENDLGDPNKVAVGLVSGTVIMVHVKGIIDYAADGNYQKFPLEAYYTNLANNGLYHIYARIDKISQKALVMYSNNVYSIDGSSSGEEGVQPKEDSYYIKIGELTATDGNSKRELTYDSGLLGTDRQVDENSNTELEKMFELDTVSTPWLIKVKEMFYEFSVKKAITLLGDFIFKDKKVSDIARSTDEEHIKNPTDEALATAGYVKKVGDDSYLSKLKEDTAQFPITFEQMITVLGLALFKDGAQFGEFIKSLYAGKGAGVDKDGNAEFESVRVRSYFECVEFIVNRLAAIEGDQILTEGDTIESVDDLGDNCYGLHLKSKWDGYFTAQYPNNVLKGIINTLSAGSGTYYTSWMRVNSVNAANNYVEVTLYPDSETPAGKNYPPCEMMKIARWGNQTEKTRQSCIYLSSTEGRIVRLTGVTKPIIEPHNYGATFGTLPEFLAAMNLPTIEGYDYVYARGLIVQDIIRIDHKGKPISEIIDRGQFTAGENYYCEALNPATGRYEISDVWYNGCKYRCAKTGTTTAPAWNNTDWAMVEGNPEFTVEFAETDYLFDPDRFALTLIIIAKLYNMDITDDILDADVQWTRYSEDEDGNERVASDTAWALKHAGAGKSIDLTVEDCDFNGYVPRTLKFIATVTLRDGMGNEAGTANAIFQY